MADNLTSILESREPKLLATGFGATEGPLWHPQGYVTFVDIRRSLLVRWDPSGKVTTVRENTGGGNGCTLDRQGRLIMCEGADRRQITRMEPDDSVIAIAQKWEGKRLNKPNDAVLRLKDGSIYFTDPTLPSDKERQLDFNGVFDITSEGQLKLGTQQCEYPNGLAFSPDESILYVANSRLDDRCYVEQERKEVCGHRYIRGFDVASDGSLINNRIFCDMSSAEPGVPDGIKVDTQGRIFCAGSGGIWVVDASGHCLAIIRMPENPRNLAFGDQDHRTLYITAGISLYSLRCRTPGITVV